MYIYIKSANITKKDSIVIQKAQITALFAQRQTWVAQLGLSQ